MKRLVLPYLAVGALLAGCSDRMQELWDPPKLSPVAISATPQSPPLGEEQYAGPTESSDWVGGPADYFRDDRARKIGDLVTVNIEIDDKANFNNSTDRSRKSSTSANTSFDLGLLSLTGAGAGKLGAGADSSAAGEGSIQRSEKLSVALAAVVKQVLPNGHLLISGSQEVLVNSEKRVLQIEGIVDSKDISRTNSVAYDRIAEARISYGGSGDVSTVQRPGWAQQAWDKLTPF